MTAAIRPTFSTSAGILVVKLSINADFLARFVGADHFSNGNSFDETRSEFLALPEDVIARALPPENWIA